MDQLKQHYKEKFRENQELVMAFRENQILYNEVQDKEKILELKF